MYYKQYFIVRRQFPVHLAAARTIHKAQGATFDGGVIHLGGSKIDHINYVGLSRVKQMSNLYILEMNENKISVSNPVQSEMERLHNNQITGCIPFLNHVHSDVSDFSKCPFPSQT